MKHRIGIATALFVFLAGNASALATSEGFDGLVLTGSPSSGAWQCNKVRIPAGVGTPTIFITGTSTNCVSGGSCSNAGGDGDLYLYTTTAGSSTPPGQRASGWTCRPYLTGDEETCSVSSPASDQYYWACVDAYAAFTQLQLRANYTYSGSGNTGGAGDGTAIYIDYWKDNLFLSVAYHRVGCMTGSTAVLANQDFDGFSNGDYCRQGQGWQSPSQYGGSTSYQISWSMGTTSYTSARATADSCNTNANNYYGTPSNAYRSNTCSYNILKNCNSDCWIRNFSDCVDGGNGSGISIKSPCW